MLSKLVPLAMLLLGTGSGVGVGVYLSAPTPVKEEKKPTASDEAQDDEYFKLANQFVVPVVEKGKVSAHVVLSLTLQVEQGKRDTAFSMEPKLRSEFLKILFEHANIGGFHGAFTAPQNLSPLNVALLEAARVELGPFVRDVLIIDIARQDVD